MEVSDEVYIIFNIFKRQTFQTSNFLNIKLFKHQTFQTINFYET